MTTGLKELCVSITDYKIWQRVATEQPESLADELFDIYITDSRNGGDPNWIIQPSLPYGEAVSSAKMHAKQVADKTPHAILHDDPPCLAPTFLCSVFFILPPDANQTELVSFSLRKAGI